MATIDTGYFVCFTVDPTLTIAQINECMEICIVFTGGPVNTVNIFTKFYHEISLK